MKTHENWPDLAGRIENGQHVMAVRVYYEDTDFSGVVYHASYLRFMERGRTDFLRLLGVDHRALFEEAGKEAPGFAFVVRSMTIEYLKPAHMDDVLTIRTSPAEIAGASKEQATGLEQINAAVGQMDEMTQRNGALVEQTSASAQALAGQARDLAELVGFFRTTAPPNLRRAA